MQKLHNWDALSVGILATMIHHVKSIISDGMEEKEVLPLSLDFAQNITEEIVVFTALESNSKLATELTSKPYLIKP